MNIKEIRNAITAEKADEITPIFTEGFGKPPSDSFLERMNEKRDLSVLLAKREGELVGFKIGYERFQGIYFSWLGAVSTQHQRTGVARALLKYQHQLCVSRGYLEIQTEAVAVNRKMLILNLQEGFEVQGVHLGRSDSLTVQLRKRFHSTHKME